jgi:hypothetical protein
MRDLSEPIDAVAVVVQHLVDAQFAKPGAVVPGSALDQMGLKDGLPVVRDHLRHGEFGIALEHVLYMIRELDLIIPADTYAVLSRSADALKLAEKLIGVRVKNSAG